MRCATLILALLGVLAFSGSVSASPGAQYGIQDDAWLTYGPGSLESRIQKLDALGVDLVRYTINWHDVEKRRGKREWGVADGVLRGLRAQRIDAVVTLYGTPRWANGGRSSNWAPTSGASFANFATAAARRYPRVKKWLFSEGVSRCPPDEVTRRVLARYEAADLITTCAWCLRLDLDGEWPLAPRGALEAIGREASLTHSICPSCAAKLSPA